MKVNTKAVQPPVAFGDYAYLIVDATQEDIAERFGPYHAEAEPLTEPGPCVYWFLEFPCGLQVGINAYEGNSVYVAANRPEGNHIALHLNLHRPTTFSFSLENPKHVAHLRSYYRQPSLVPYPLECSWRVMRQDDNGNRVEVGKFQREESATCAANILEASGHKQTYWVENAQT